jgi:hypothetical protein
MKPKVPGTVQCDQPHCGWSSKVVNTLDWRDEPCPHCGHQLMNDKAKAAMDAVAGLMLLGLAFAADDPNKPDGTVRVTIDSRKIPQ